MSTIKYYRRGTLLATYVIAFDTQISNLNILLTGLFGPTQAGDTFIIEP